MQSIVTYQSKMLSTKYHAKDKTEFYHQNNLVYYGKSLSQICRGDYIRETDPRINEKIIDRNKRDKNSHLIKRTCEEGYSHVWNKDFKVLGNNYCSAFRSKISEVLFIKQLKSSLNVKEKLIQLELYNLTSSL